MSKFLHGVLTGVLVLFFAIMLIFRVVDGSFEAAGKRMDKLTGVTAKEVGAAAGELAGDIAEKTDEVIKDVADGPDTPD